MTNFNGQFIPAGEPVTVEFNMKRDLLNDTRVAASLSAFLRPTDGLPAEGDSTDVRFVDFAGLMVLKPLYPGGTGAPLDRNGCHYVGLLAWPETIPVVINLSSSETRGVPDLTFSPNSCEEPSVSQFFDFNTRDTNVDYHYVLRVKRAPGNTGTSGTLTAIGGNGFTFNPDSEPLTFKQRASLIVTAPVSTNLPANACVKATVKVGAFDFPSMKVRVSSGSGNARVYDSPGCLTTIATFTLPPKGSRDVWVKPVAPDVEQASLVADTGNLGNVEPSKPPAAGLAFYFTH